MKLFYFGFVLTAAVSSLYAGETPEQQAKTMRDYGFKWIAEQQREDGSYGKSDNVSDRLLTTAVVLVMFEWSQYKYAAQDGPFISKAQEFVKLNKAKVDSTAYIKQLDNIVSKYFPPSSESTQQINPLSLIVKHFVNYKSNTVGKTYGSFIPPEKTPANAEDIMIYENADGIMHDDFMFTVQISYIIDRVMAMNEQLKRQAEIDLKSKQ